MEGRNITADDVKAAAEVVADGASYYQLIADKLNAIARPKKLQGYLGIEGYGRHSQAVIVKSIPYWSNNGYKSPRDMAEAVKGDYGIVEVNAVSFSSGRF